MEAQGHWHRQAESHRVKEEGFLEILTRSVCVAQHVDTCSQSVPVFIQADIKIQRNTMAHTNK